MMVYKYELHFFVIVGIYISLRLYVRVPNRRQVD